MTGQAARSWVLGSWLVMLGLVTVKQVSAKPGLPNPGAYLSSAVVFTLLFGLAGLAPSLAAALAAGTVVGGAVAPYLKGRTTGILDQAATYLGTLSGSNPPPAPAQSPGMKLQPGTPGQ